MSRPFVVLSLSGGGYCGLYTASILEELERMRGGSVLADAVDLVVGTSIGGIIALGVSFGIPASKIRAIIQERGPWLFYDNRSWVFRKAINFGADALSLFFAKYSSQRLGGIAKEILGDRTIFDALRPLAVSSVCVNLAKPQVFRNYGHDRGIAFGI